GAKSRYRPIVPIHILAPVTLPPVDACIDSASDDTVFPPRLAALLGIDLASAPQGQARVVGGAGVTRRYARGTLPLSDGWETSEWEAIVAFSTVPMRWALLGHAGFLDFFDVQLLGARREAVIVPNTAFPGQYLIHTPPPP